MAGIELEFLNIQRDREGRPRYAYFRRHGRRWRLPGAWPQNPPSEEFMAAYRRQLNETGGAAEHIPLERRHLARGSFGGLIADFLASGQFRTKRPRTRAEYQRICEALSLRHGGKPVRLIEKRHVRKMRDERADTPGAANTVLRMLKILLNFAVEDGLIAASPAAKMKELPVGEWRAWTDVECDQFEARWAEGTMQRRAYALALYTGQRISDLVAMTRADREDGLIHVATQSKTGEELWIPEHRTLTEELARGVSGISALLTTPTQGKPFDPVYFGAWFADAIEKAKLPEDCVTHGLRKCAARKLADVGCSTEEIKAIIGHKTDRMVAHYTKSADKRRRAKAAIGKWENAK